MSSTDLSTYINNRFSEIVISGNAIALRLRRDVIGATPQQIRTAVEGVSRLNPGVWGGVLDYEEFGGVRCGVVNFNNKFERSILWVHGGAFAFGSARVYRAVATYLAKRLNAEVIIPEYRLSPENKYPAAFEDVLAAYKSVVENKGKVDVIGDSAGGNMACLLAQKCCSDELELPKSLVLLSPWMDLSEESRSNVLNTTDYSPFDNLDTVAYANEYLDGKVSGKDSAVSPIYGEFKGLPRTHIQASKVEFLYTDTTRAIEKLDAAGVEHTVHFEEKAMHGWHTMPDILPEAARSMKEVVKFLS